MAEIPVQPNPGIASQDFRDGASTGAALIARRLRKLIAWGVKLDERTIDALAEGIVYEYGGCVYVSEHEA